MRILKRISINIIFYQHNCLQIKFYFKSLKVCLLAFIMGKGCAIFIIINIRTNLCNLVNDHARAFRRPFYGGWFSFDSFSYASGKMFHFRNIQMPRYSFWIWHYSFGIFVKYRAVKLAKGRAFARNTCCGRMFAEGCWNVNRYERRHYIICIHRVFIRLCTMMVFTKCIRMKYLWGRFDPQPIQYPSLWEVQLPSQIYDLPVVVFYRNLYSRNYVSSKRENTGKKSFSTCVDCWKWNRPFAKYWYI